MKKTPSIPKQTPIRRPYANVASPPIGKSMVEMRAWLESIVLELIAETATAADLTHDARVDGVLKFVRMFKTARRQARYMFHRQATA